LRGPARAKLNRADFQLERWYSPDDGASWESDPVTTDRNHHMRAVVPRAHPAGKDFPLFYMAGRHTSFEAFRPTWP
jgi:hypothetical protein